jgi:hypothetical protein
MLTWRRARSGHIVLCQDTTIRIHTESKPSRQLQDFDQSVCCMSAYLHELPVAVARDETIASEQDLVVELVKEKAAVVDSAVEVVETVAVVAAEVAVRRDWAARIPEASDHKAELPGRGQERGTLSQRLARTDRKLLRQGS